MATRSNPTIEAEGETIDEAIANALATLGIPREGAEVEIVRDAKRSLLGFGGQSARVRVSARTDVTAATVDADRTAAKTGLPEEDDPAVILRTLLSLMDIPAEIETAPAEEPGQTWLRISSPAGGLLIGRHGQTLDALEYVVNRIVGRHDAERASRILLDAEGYRERRSRELCEMASRIAARVRQTSRPHTMNPLSARERRIVHMALAADTTVGTSSVGEGHSRCVVISPTREPRGSRGSTGRS